MKQIKQKDCNEACSDHHCGAGDLVGQGWVVEAVGDGRHDVLALLSQLIVELLDGATGIAQGLKDHTTNHHGRSVKGTPWGDSTTSS